MKPLQDMGLTAVAATSTSSSTCSRLERGSRHHASAVIPGTRKVQSGLRCDGSMEDVE